MTTYLNTKVVGINFNRRLQDASLIFCNAVPIKTRVNGFSIRARPVREFCKSEPVRSQQTLLAKCVH